MPQLRDRYRSTGPGVVRPGTFALSLALHAAGIVVAVALTVEHRAARARWSAVAVVPSAPSERQPDVPVPAPPAVERPPIVAEPPAQEPVELPSLPEPPSEPPSEPLPEPLPAEPREAPAPPPEQVPESRPVPASAWLARLVPRPAGPAAAELSPPEQAQEPEQTTAAREGGFVAPTVLPGTNRPPSYPLVPWRRGIEGTVVVILEVDTEGRVTAAHVERSSGCSALDDAALRQLATWRFEPGRRGGVAVPSTFRQEVVFRLVP